MTASQRRLWMAVRRALLMICKAIEREVGGESPHEETPCPLR